MKKSLALLLALAMLLALAACGTSTQSNETEEAPVEETEAAPAVESPAEPAEEEEHVVEATGKPAPESLTIGVDQQLGAFLDGSDASNCYVGQGMIYDKIIGFDDQAKEYVSDILEGWEYEDDCTLVLHVREGITFADGATLDAEDILYTLKGYIDRNSNIAAQFDAIDFEASNCPDPYTVVVVTKQPYGPLLDALSVYVYDKGWVEENTWSSEAWTTSPNGSGPYELTEYVSGAYAVFELRDDYWGWELKGEDYSLPKTVTLKYYGEASAMYIDLEMGALDVASGISSEDLTRSKDNDEISTLVIPSGDVRWFALNLSYNEVLADENVRLAIAHAIDWEAIGIAFVGDKYIPADSMISVKSKYYEPIGTYEYDPDLARELLAESGYTPEQLTFLYAGLASGAGYAELVQAYLADVGITVVPDIADFGSTIVKWLSPDGTDMNCQITATGVPTGEPWISLQQLDPEIGSFPGVTIKEDTAMDLLHKAVYTVDEAERQQYFTEFAQYCYDHALAIPTYQANGAVAWRSEVISDVAFNMYRLALPQNMIWA